MLDRLFHSSGAAFAFIFFVIILFIFYMVNRERSQVQRLKGPRRFEPRWTARGGSRRRRRRRPGGQFKPDWNRRDRPDPVSGADDPEAPPGGQPDTTDTQDPPPPPAQG